MLLHIYQNMIIYRNNNKNNNNNNNDNKNILELSTSSPP